MATDLEYEIKEIIGTIAEKGKVWKLELSIVSWNGKEPKYDIRSWNKDHSMMKKGITFTKEELQSLKNILNEMEELD